MNVDVSTNIENKGIVSLPRFIILQLQEACNLRCKMCYEWGKYGSYKKKPELAMLDIEVVKKVIKDCCQVKPHYELFGGEPLMYSHVEEVISEIKKYGSTLDIPTNGVLIGELSEMLVETKPDHLWVSLDGPEEVNDFLRGKGVYDKVVNGMKRLDGMKKIKGVKYPRLGIGTTVTPYNYMFIEKFFLECFDMSMIDQISIELQIYTTQSNYDQYFEILKHEFNIQEAPVTKGIICNLEDFKNMDFKELSRQLSSVKAFCKDNNICFNMHPEEISEENIRYYFSGEWHKMTGCKKKCIYPWISAEINAKGDVTSCHTLYDLTHGNINQQSISDIWNGDNYNKFRKLIKKGFLTVCPACYFFYHHVPTVNYF